MPYYGDPDVSYDARRRTYCRMNSFDERNKLALQLDPYYIYKQEKENDSFGFQTRIANEMVERFVRTEQGKDFNLTPIQEPDSSYKYFNSNGTAKVSEGEVSFENPDPFSNYHFMANSGKEKSYVKGFHFERNTGRLEVEIETCIFSTREYPMWTDVSYDIDSNNICGDGKLTKWKIKSNLTIIIKSRAEPIYNVPLSERVAIDTLREMITESEFRKYATHGFILVKGNSGNVYQIFRNRAHTKVWKDGQLIKEICVRISIKVPPTDNVIAFKTMIETDEDEFERIGNVYPMIKAA